MTWRSAYEPVDAGAPTLPDIVRERARRAPGAPALVDGATGAVRSYGDVADGAGGVAAWLAARGFRPGDVLALWAPNAPAWAEVALGAMAAGGCVTGVSPLATDRELALHLADAAPAVVVAPATLRERALAAAPASVREVVTLEEAAASVPGPVPAADPGALALLPYSSGTTGLPKGVMLTHANLAAALGQLGRGLRLEPRDVVLAAPPFAHVMGFVVTCALPLASGASLVTLPRFDLAALLSLVERERVTVLVVPPPVMGALAAHPLVDRHDLSSLELVVSGGAPLGAERQRAVAARLPWAAVGQGWGMTETCVGVTGPDRARGTSPGSVGRLLASTELRVVDPQSGRDLGPGEAGELWARGPQNTPGYLGRPGATAELLDADGWLHTGDLGRVDEHGDVWIVDRLKELIKVSGHQVAPAELEALLSGHPGVADAAVVPEPDEERGEVPVAVVVPRGELDPDGLMAWVAERVAPYKRIRAVRTADAIPRTPSGKILRRQLRLVAHATG